MTRFLILAATALALAAGSVSAQDKGAAKQPTAQQSKMSSCNKDAGDKGLKGDDRRKFMSECLSAQKSARAAQQEKMKTCNKDASAKGLKGGERRTFMSSCLKG